MADAMHINGAGRPNRTQRLFVQSRLVSRIPRLNGAEMAHPFSKVSIDPSVSFVSRFIPFYVDAVDGTKIDLSKLKTSLLSDINAFCRQIRDAAENRRLRILRVPVLLGSKRFSMPFIFPQSLIDAWVPYHRTVYDKIDISIYERIFLLAAGKWWKVNTAWPYCERELVVGMRDGLCIHNIVPIRELMLNRRSEVRFIDPAHEYSVSLRSEGVASITALEIKKGATIIVKTTGPDCEEAMEKTAKWILGTGTQGWNSNRS